MRRVVASVAGVLSAVAVAGTSQAMPVEEAPTVTVALTGDIMPGAYDYGIPSDGGRGTFAGVRRQLDADLTIGNLEGALTQRPSAKCGVGGPNCFVFRIPPAYAGVLKRAGFDVLNVANNHAQDAGFAGFRDTQRELGQRGLRSTGAPGSIAYLRRNGLRVAVVGFAADRGGNRVQDLPRAKALVARADRRADVVIVTFHGGAEGASAQRTPWGTETFLGGDRGNLRRFGRVVVDAGADLVVGHGPHVLRGMEFRGGRLIAYSLGNFVGYRAFNLGGPNGVSAVLRATLDGRGCLVGARIAPVRVRPPGRPFPGGPAVRSVRTLSQLDFGPRAAWIADDGRVAARNRGPCRPPRRGGAD